METIRLAKIAASTRNAMAAVKTTAKSQTYSRLAMRETNLFFTVLTAFSFARTPLDTAVC
jgi:hypothetical protein